MGLIFVINMQWRFIADFFFVNRGNVILMDNNITNVHFNYNLEGFAFKRITAIANHMYFVAGLNC